MKSFSCFLILTFTILIFILDQSRSINDAETDELEPIKKKTTRPSQSYHHRSNHRYGGGGCNHHECYHQQHNGSSSKILKLILFAVLVPLVIAFAFPSLFAQFNLFPRIGRSLFTFFPYYLSFNDGTNFTSFAGNSAPFFGFPGYFEGFSGVALNQQQQQQSSSSNNNNNNNNNNDIVSSGSGGYIFFNYTGRSMMINQPFFRQLTSHNDINISHS